MSRGTLSFCLFSCSLLAAEVASAQVIGDVTVAVGVLTATVALLGLVFELELQERLVGEFEIAYCWPALVSRGIAALVVAAAVDAVEAVLNFLSVSFQVASSPADSFLRMVCVVAKFSVVVVVSLERCPSFYFVVASPQ